MATTANLSKPLTSSKRKSALQHFLMITGWYGAKMEILASDASSRQYFRLSQFEGTKRILMDDPIGRESCEKFIQIDKILKRLGYSVPEIFDHDLNHGFLLLGDLGTMTFAQALTHGMDEKMLYEAAVDVLIDLHQRYTEKDEGLETYTHEKYLEEVLLFIDWYLPIIFKQKPTQEMRLEFIKAWTQTFSFLENIPQSLVLRDFHVDNLIWLQDQENLKKCGLLDFQDALIGPVPYDLVSLLQDVRRDVSQSMEDEMIARYLKAFPHLDPFQFKAAYAVLGAQRNTRILGTFTRLYFNMGKKRYLEFLPRTWALVKKDLDHISLAPVKEWFHKYGPRTPHD